MPSAFRKIVFHRPSLVTGEAGPRRDWRAGAGGLEPAVLVANGDVIHRPHLSPTLETAEAPGTVVSQSLAEAVGVFESNLIQDALKSSRGNRAKAARLLNTTERILSYKVRRYGIDPRRFRG